MTFLKQQKKKKNVRIEAQNENKHRFSILFETSHMTYPV